MDSKTTPPPDSTEKLIIRRMTPPDIPTMARIACTEYFDSPLNTFLCPHRHQYPNDLLRRFVQMIRGRYLSPRSIGFVAVSASAPGIPLGYAQFIRLGNDDAAKRLVSAQASFWLSVRRWWNSLCTTIENYVWPDRSLDEDAMQQFDASAEIDERTFWGSDEMKARYGERWHVQSVVVSSKCQRRGLGRMLMGEVLRRAQEEGVVVGLEASKDGEKLYQSLGFELRGRFSRNFGEVVGGVMMWSPKNLQ
ncbi:hypothetical protein N7510_002953 [Penicillium lagena]|uniref:uncharacterized protein n=1 Tax=Penicillium lagena TaxID=94218 RepID=UPI00254256CB|nr:uncharacterized protein N7510_002953 [Penicillium lagena]KAJ5618969.1 hypothetical protein N7510_002953 [Penicillium lagena]